MKADLDAGGSDLTVMGGHPVVGTITESLPIVHQPRGQPWAPDLRGSSLDRITPHHRLLVDRKRRGSDFGKKLPSPGTRGHDHARRVDATSMTDHGRMRRSLFDRLHLDAVNQLRAVATSDLEVRAHPDLRNHQSRTRFEQTTMVDGQIEHRPAPLQRVPVDFLDHDPMGFRRRGRTEDRLAVGTTGQQHPAAVETSPPGLRLQSRPSIEGLPRKRDVVGMLEVGDPNDPRATVSAATLMRWMKSVEPDHRCSSASDGGQHRGTDATRADHHDGSGRHGSGLQADGCPIHEKEDGPPDRESRLQKGSRQTMN